MYCFSAIAKGRDTTILDTVKDHYLIFSKTNPPEFEKDKLMDSLLSLPSDTSIIRIHSFNCASLNIDYDIQFKVGSRWDYKNSKSYSAENVSISNTGLADSTCMNPERHIFMLTLQKRSSGQEQNSYFLVVKGEIVKSLILEDLKAPIFNSEFESDLKYFASVDKFFRQRRRPSVESE